MDLREKIALAAKTALAQCGSGHYEPFEVMADAILAIPEIRDALRERHEQLGVATKLGRI